MPSAPNSKIRYEQLVLTGKVKKADTDTSIWKTDGTETATGNFNLGTNRITTLGNPTAAQDAATKAYVDASIQGMQIKETVKAATTANLTVTYSNGSSGVGATLTNAGAQAALVLDDVTLSVNDRVLVKNQTTQTQNGIYVVTNVGSGATNWVLTRASDADNSNIADGTTGTQYSSEVKTGMFTFVEAGGTAHGGSGWALTTAGTITLGTSNLTFSQFSGIGASGAALTKSDDTNVTLTLGGSPSNALLSAVSLSLGWTGTLSISRGGTGTATYGTNFGTLYYDSTNNKLASTGTGTSGQFLKSAGPGAAPAYASITVSDVGSAAALTKTDDTNVTLTLGGTPASSLLSAVSLTLGWTGQLSVGRGGTGAATFTQYGVIYGNAAAALGATAVGTTGQYLKSGNGIAAPSFASITASEITSGAALTKTDDTNVTLTLGGTASSALLAATSITVGWSGTLAIGRGGSGASSFATNFGTIYYDSTNGKLATTATGTSGQFLKSAGPGVAPAYASITASDVTSGAALTKTDDTNVTLTLGGTPASALLTAASITVGWTGVLSIARGGSNNSQSGTGGNTAYTQYGTLYYDGTRYLTTGPGTSGQVFISNGTAAPTFQTLSLTNISDTTVKKEVKVATTANLTNIATGAPNTLDGVSLVANDRILVKDQSTASQNGIYFVSTLGTGANGVWARVTDADTSAEIAGAMVQVDQGTANAGKLFYTKFKSTDTLGTTSMAWIEIADVSTAQTFTTKTLSTGTVLSGASSITMSLGSDATGDVYYRNASGYLTRLAVGTSAQGLIGGTTPTWSTVVQSVGSLSPLFTTSGTSAITFAQVAQSGNTVFASPSNGSSGNPTFRSLVAADLPTGTLNATNMARDQFTGDGTTVVFTMSYSASSIASGGSAVSSTTSEMVFLNGQLLKKGSAGVKDYYFSTGTSVITFNFTPDSGDVIEVVYFK